MVFVPKPFSCYTNQENTCQAKQLTFRCESTRLSWYTRLEYLVRSFRESTKNEHISKEMIVNAFWLSAQFFLLSPLMTNHFGQTYLRMTSSENNKQNTFPNKTKIPPEEYWKSQSMYIPMSLLPIQSTWAIFVFRIVNVKKNKTGKVLCRHGSRAFEVPA